MRSSQSSIIVVVAFFALGCADASPTGPDEKIDRATPRENVWIPNDPGECDPWQDINWCEEPTDPGDGTCVTAVGAGDADEVASTEGCSGPGGPGGTAPPDDNADPDTCDTGDQILDDPEFSAGLRSLWSQSKPDANLYSRVEKAGWIVEYPAGEFSVVQWTGGVERFGCGDYSNLAVPQQGKIVGFVHTHPYEVGEAITDCSFRTVQIYDGTPSDFDRRASVQLGTVLGRSGPLPGYIIDKDGYYRYDGQTNTARPRTPRCGY